MHYLTARTSGRPAVCYASLVRGATPRNLMDEPVIPNPVCPRCGASLAAGASTCGSCGQDLLGTSAMEADVAENPTRARTSESPSSWEEALGKSASLKLSPGFEIAQRYRIVGLLGRGGMGTVYRAHDRELNREVALKLLNSEIAQQKTALERFKQEIQLSSQITHKNVLRVYDLGAHESLRFLTMQFVEGEDLASLLLREGRLPLPRVIAVFRQIAMGLQAAHEIGVIHRDLKPQNIMVDRADRVYVTDFGLAKLQEASGMTETGTLFGTPRYMSPEQVKGETLDARSDIYSLGVMLYELLTGEIPFSGGTPYEVMARRLHSNPRPAIELNPEIPPWLRGVLDRCLAREPAARYPNIEALLANVDTKSVHLSLALEAERHRWLKPAALGALGLLLAFGGYRLVARRPGPPPSAAPARTVLIADFENRTGESVFDGTLEPALGVALEGASFITSYPRASAKRIAAQLRPEAPTLDESLARLVAGREGIEVVTAGSVEKKGEEYAIAIRALDTVTGKPLTATTAAADGKAAVLASVTRLAAAVRRDLGDTTPESAQLAAAETFTAASLEAAHEYALAQEAQWAGRWEDAIAAYTKATELDPNLGRAYAGLAAVENNRGRRQEAEKYYKLAMARIDRMSEREKHRTRGAYYLVVSRNADNAIQEFEALVSKYPADSAGLANLAVAYQLKRDFAKALEQARRAIAIYPKNVPQRNNVGLFATYAGDFEAAVREQQAVLELNPQFVSGHAGLALAQLAAGRPEEARATWQKLETLGPAGASTAALGLADLALYAGKAAEARSHLESSIEADLAAEDPDSAAYKLTLLAEAHLLEGHRDRATAAALRARRTSESDAVSYCAGRALVEAGETKGALAIAEELERSLEAEPQMYGHLLRGEIELRRGAAREALTRFKEAERLVDTWPSRFGQGRAYLAASAFTEAHGQLEACLRRRGEATDLFLNVWPTYRFLPSVHYELGRTNEGLKSPEAAAAFRTFVDIKKEGTDPRLEDARRRLAGR